MNLVVRSWYGGPREGSEPPGIDVEFSYAINFVIQDLDGGWRETYAVGVRTPRWIERHLGEDDVYRAEGTVIVRKWDAARIEAFLSSRVAEMRAETVKEARQLMNEWATSQDAYPDDDFRERY